MWSKLQRRMQPKITMRDEAVAIHPLEFDEVPIFNVTGGYGNFILPAVLVLIIQQALLLGVGMLAGTRREKLYLTNVDPAPMPLAEILGRATAYFLIFAVMLAWITLVVPRIFGRSGSPQNPADTGACPRSLHAPSALSCGVCVLCHVYGQPCFLS